MATHANSTSTRRRLVAGGAASVAITAGASASAQRRDAGCDAELIAACDRFIEAWRTDGREGGLLDCEVCPLWQALDRERNAVLALPAVTIAGVVAKARAAREVATLPGQIDYSDGIAGPFPGQVIEDLLRIAPGALA